MILEAKEVGFYYRKDHWIFENINLSLESEMVTVLLGDSGLGKSTLAKIFAGYEKTHRRIERCDGFKCRDLCRPWEF